ncbi:MAG: hypothetical protein ACLQDA_04200, partial [Terracidiphilus sp.]
MKLSRISAFGLLLLAPGVAALFAAALDAPHPLHHSRAAESHLSESHHASHRAAARRSAAARAGATHGAQKTLQDRSQPRLTARGSARAGARRVALTRRRHHYYERFTASSFASDDMLAGDLTAGEDPVVRQAAVDALGDMNGTAVV